jgi:hypothetical protein
MTPFWNGLAYCWVDLHLNGYVISAQGVKPVFFVYQWW